MLQWNNQNDSLSRDHSTKLFSIKKQRQERIREIKVYNMEQPKKNNDTEKNKDRRQESRSRREPEKKQNNFADSLQNIVLPLLKWYDSHARILPWRENPEPYAVWISEIMLQQTRVEAVKPYFDRWLKAFPTLSSLAAAPEEEVLKLWEGLGYYSRARNIHKTAKIVMQEYGGQLPRSFNELLKLPGIGEYSAGSIGSIAFQLQVPCVDGNVLRVITRVTAEKSDITETSTKRLLTEWVKAIVPANRPGDFNQALMELGATICLPSGIPKCESCPISCYCQALLGNRTTDFPVKKPNAERKKEKRTVLLLVRGGSTAVRKREDSGLLAGLWEYPNYPGELSESDVMEKLKHKGISSLNVTKLKKSKHIFTHLEWHLTGYLILIKDDGLAFNDDEYLWVKTSFLRDRLTIPTAFKAYHQFLLSDFPSHDKIL
ncbi:MAG: A/G-specific adenine glycosylase [Bacillota bacterium]|nr:A/G-specific adenine glycosylase [Bacillota bacterium]